MRNLAGGCATLAVEDVDRSIAFYTDVLGMSVLFRWQDEWTCLDAGNGMRIALIPRTEETQSPMSLWISAMDDFEGVVENLGHHGISLALASDAGGAVRRAHLTDPDGHALYVTNFLPNPSSGSTGQDSDQTYRPFFEHLNLRWNPIDADRMSVEIDVRDDLRGPSGTLQGGIIATLIDVAAASTAALTGRSFVATTELTIHYLAPGRAGPIRAVGELLRSGTRGFAVETRVFDAGIDDRLMAVALAAFASLRPDRSARS